MPIFVSQAVLHENKNSSDKMLPPVRVEIGPLILSLTKPELNWHVLLRVSPNFCSDTI